MIELQYTRGRSKNELQKRDFETLQEHEGMVLGKPKLTWTQHLQGTSWEARRAAMLVGNE